MVEHRLSPVCAKPNFSLLQPLLDLLDLAVVVVDFDIDDVGIHAHEVWGELFWLVLDTRCG